jgi:formate dehydrogenase maturation protein FdhE
MIISDIILFSRLLDGAVYLRCACGHEWRAVAEDRACAACGRPRDLSVASTEDAYRASRK